MKKILTAILLFDALVGLLFLGFCGLQKEAVATDSRLMKVTEGEEKWEDGDVRKIAITFDGERIIWLNQKIAGKKR